MPELTLAEDRRLLDQSSNAVARPFDTAEGHRVHVTKHADGSYRSRRHVGVDEGAEVDRCHEIATHDEQRAGGWLGKPTERPCGAHADEKTLAARRRLGAERPAPTPAPVPVPPGPPPFVPKQRVHSYVVKGGDTLFQIATRLNVPGLAGAVPGKILPSSGTIRICCFQDSY